MMVIIRSIVDISSNRKRISGKYLVMKLIRIISMGKCFYVVLLLAVLIKRIWLIKIASLSMRTRKNSKNPITIISWWRHHLWPLPANIPHLSFSLKYLYRINHHYNISSRSMRRTLKYATFSKIYMLFIKSRQRIITIKIILDN